MAGDTKDTTDTKDTDQDTDTDDTSTDADTDGASVDSPELKADLEGLPEEAKKIVEEKVKSLNKDYTQKTQKLAADRKAMETVIKDGEYWKNWSKENEQGIKEYNEALEKKKDKDDDSSDSDDTVDDVFGEDTDAGVKKVRAETKKGFEEQEKKMQAGMNYLVDLVDVVRDDEFKDLKIDSKKVIAFAYKRGITDVKEAVRSCYGKELGDLSFKERLAEEKEKWEKENVKVLSINMPGRTARKVVAKARGK